MSVLISAAVTAALDAYADALLSTVRDDVRYWSREQFLGALMTDVSAIPSERVSLGGDLMPSGIVEEIE